MRKRARASKETPQNFPRTWPSKEALLVVVVMMRNWEYVILFCGMESKSLSLKRGPAARYCHQNENRPPLWSHLWQRKEESRPANATYVRWHLLRQAIWDNIWKPTLHYVYFVQYDDAVSDTIRRSGGYRGIITEEGVDTVIYFVGNHSSRVWKSL